ncbi:MAG: DUF3795 domain-containing protein [Nanoarchaeota archaeon]
MEENKLAYCGLYCPKCYKNAISKSANKLKYLLKSTSIFNSTHMPSKEFQKELETLISLKCSRPCKENNEKDCPIKKCCIEKKIKGCWECKNYENCKNLKPQFIKNIRLIQKCG